MARTKVPKITTKEECEAGGVSDFRQSSCLPPRRSQTDSTWCYAYAAAELLSFEVCHPVSAPAVALAYTEHDRKSTSMIDEGNVRQAAESALKEGLCREEDMPSTIIQNGRSQEMIEFYRSFGRKKGAGGAISRGSLPDPQAAFPKLNRVAVMKAYWSEDSDGVFLLKKKACKKRIAANLEILESWGNPVEQIKFVDKWIRKGPVVFGVDSRGLPAERLSNGSFPWSGNHAVTLVGRGWNKAAKQCGFWVKDSAAKDAEPAFGFVSHETLQELMRWDPTSTSNAVIGSSAAR